MVNKRRSVREDLTRLRELFAELASNLACTLGRLRSHMVDDASHEVSAVQLRGERKRVEEALRSSETRLRLVIDTIPAVAWGALPDGSGARADLGRDGEQHATVGGELLRGAACVRPYDRAKPGATYRAG